MTNHDLPPKVLQAFHAADHGNTLLALLELEEAAVSGTTPLLNSYLGFCLARERRQFKQAVALCREALQREPHVPQHYLNLGRIYLEAGQKAQAIKAFRQGLRHGRDRQILRELENLGSRKPPVLASLPRTHPLNRYLGMLLHRLRLR